MVSAARQKGIAITSQSRPLTPDDLNSFDHILAMDPKNIKAINVRCL
jgi:protein-tyrosine phosphatase